MNKTELVAAIAYQADLSKKDAEKALKAFVNVITDELKKGEKIQLVGLGSFEVTEENNLWDQTWVQITPIAAILINYSMFLSIHR